jgi:hypothetical protein
MFASTVMCWEQRVGLKHHVDGPPVRRDTAQILPVEQEASRCRFLEAGEHTQKRRLSAARRTEKREELTLKDVQRQVVDRGEVAKAFGDVLERYVWLGTGIGPRREASANASERFHSASGVPCLIEAITALSLMHMMPVPVGIMPPEEERALVIEGPVSCRSIDR